MRARSHWAAESPSPAAGTTSRAARVPREPSTRPDYVAPASRSPAAAPTFDRGQHFSERNIGAHMLRPTYGDPPMAATTAGGVIALPHEHDRQLDRLAHNTLGDVLMVPGGPDGVRAHNRVPPTIKRPRRQTAVSVPGPGLESALATAVMDARACVGTGWASAGRSPLLSFVLCTSELAVTGSGRVHMHRRDSRPASP